MRIRTGLPTTSYREEIRSKRTIPFCKERKEKKTEIYSLISRSLERNKRAVIARRVSQPVCRNFNEGPFGLSAREPRLAGIKFPDLRSDLSTMAVAPADCGLADSRALVLLAARSADRLSPLPPARKFAAARSLRGGY